MTKRSKPSSVASPIWVRVDVNARCHRKQIAAGGEANWLWVCGLMWCNSQK